MIGEYVLRKLACPDGSLAGFFSKLLNLSNARLNAAVIGTGNEVVISALAA